MDASGRHDWRRSANILRDAFSHSGCRERGCTSLEPDICAPTLMSTERAQSPLTEHSPSTHDACSSPQSPPPLSASPRSPNTRRLPGTVRLPSLSVLPSFVDDVGREHGASPRSLPVITPPTSPRSPRAPECDAQYEPPSSQRSQSSVIGPATTPVSTGGVPEQTRPSPASQPPSRRTPPWMTF